MATIGRKRAVVQFRGIRFGGFVAWVAWLFIHIFYLIGFKNRISVFAQWTWSYLTFKRGARLITEKEWRENPAPSTEVRTSSH
jgi:NADH dehydrogenase